MNRFFINLPIRYKIIGLTILIVTVVILPTLIFVLKQEYDLVDKNLTRQCQTYINLLDADVDVLLSEPDPVKAKKLLSPLEKFADVENVALYVFNVEKNTYQKIIQYNKTQSENSEFAFDIPFITNQEQHIFEYNGYLMGYDYIERNAEKKGLVIIRLTKAIAKAQIQSLALNSVALVIGLLIVAWFIANLIQRRITQPIVELSDIANHITQEGDYSIKVAYDSKDEIGKMYQSFNRLLIRTNNQNQKIQELNQSLDQKIQDRVADLTKATQEAEKRTQEANTARLTAESVKIELERKMTFDAGLAKFAEIMQARSTENIEKWGDHLLFHIIEHINGLQGALYTSDEIAASEPKLRLISTYAYDIKLILKKVMKAGDGFTGEVAKTRRMIYMDNLPDGYLKAVSALGESNPRYLLIMPLIAEDAVQGVLELASFHPFKDDDINFLTAISENIAYALLVVKNRDNIQRLLNESEQKNNMLIAQEEQLKLKIQELEQTQMGMQRAQKGLSESEENLRILNENLEHLVEDRTSELQQTLANLQSTQAQLVQSEKMASLGQLIAGVAHEINTPIGAIKASSGNIEDVLPFIINDLPEWMTQLTERQRGVFRQLVMTGFKGEKSLSSKEERAKRKELTQYLMDMGAPHAEDNARKLIDCGIIEIETPYLELLQLDQSDQILDLVYKMCQLKLNLNNIQIATEKTKKIVFALKSYAYKQSDDHATPTNISQSMDVILTLYSNQMKQGVELIRNFEENLPEIPAYPDEIGQVWTNIIHNALQAMKYQGTLQVDIFKKANYTLTDEAGQNTIQDCIIIEMTDSGQGIPPEIQQKIFEPFFTTKPKGEGTGLGLDICAKIIRKHKGEISVNSVPGRTTFKVALPVA